MKEYKSIAEAKAKPMNRLDYNTMRGWELPSDENGSDDGYIVVTEGKPNVDGFDGYVSWSTKEQFESTYVEV